MKTVREMSQASGVSIRTLQYYDRIGLLRPACRTEAGYRLYGDRELERLGQILLFRELEFPLREIRAILDRPGFDRARALEQQIALLRLKKERLERLLEYACGIQMIGGKIMDLSVFDSRQLARYTEEARAAWGSTEAWRAFEEKDAARTDAQRQTAAKALMELFVGFGGLRGQEPAGAAAWAQVKALQDFITANYYPCTRDILRGLGQMYTSDTRMRENIDAAGGPGTAEFAGQAIAAYCDR